MAGPSSEKPGSRSASWPGRTPPRRTLVQRARRSVGTLALPIASQSPDTTGLLAIVLSFFVLQAIGYLVEAYRRTTTDLDPVRRSLALIFFPSLLAGPIVKRAEIEEQITRRVVSVANFAYGVRRFAIGLFKKVALADILGQIADTIFALPPSQVAAARASLGIGCFALQAYFSITAYSDMALGLGRMWWIPPVREFQVAYVARSMRVLGRVVRDAWPVAPRLCEAAAWCRTARTDARRVSRGGSLVRHALDICRVGALSCGVRRG
jgi:hypothetical protein